MSLCLYNLLMTQYAFGYLVLPIGQSLKQRSLVYCLQKSLTRVRLVNEIKSLLNRKQHLGTETQEELLCLAISLLDSLRRSGNKFLDQKALQKLCLSGTSTTSLFFYTCNNKHLVQKANSEVSKIKGVNKITGVCMDAVA